MVDGLAKTQRGLTRNQQWFPNWNCDHAAILPWLVCSWACTQRVMTCLNRKVRMPSSVPHPSDCVQQNLDHLYVPDFSSLANDHRWSVLPKKKRIKSTYERDHWLCNAWLTLILIRPWSLYRKPCICNVYPEYFLRVRGMLVTLWRTLHILLFECLLSLNGHTMHVPAYTW